MDASFIRQAFDKYNTDKGRDHQYEHMYSPIFSRYNITTLLEIGVEYGNSIAAWKELFPNVMITGIDITERDLVLPKTSFNYIIGDSGDKEMMQEANQTYDIIIDDASNDLIDQALTFNVFKDKFNCCYVIEDIYSNAVKYNDRVDVLQKFIASNGFKSIYKYASQKRRNGLLINTMALIIHKV